MYVVNALPANFFGRIFQSLPFGGEFDSGPPYKELAFGS